MLLVQICIYIYFFSLLPLRDSYMYDVLEDKVTEFRGKIPHGDSIDQYQKGSGPPPTFTQRGVLDTNRQVFIIFIPFISLT